MGNQVIQSIAAAPAGMVIYYSNDKDQLVKKPVVCLALVAEYDTYCEVTRRIVPMVLSDNTEAKIIPMFSGFLEMEGQDIQEEK